MRNIFEYVLMELRRRKSRTLTNIFGYLLAVLIMVVLISIIIMAHSAQSTILEGVGVHFVAYVPLGEEKEIMAHELDVEELCCPRDYMEHYTDVVIDLAEVPANEGLLFGSVRTKILPSLLGDGRTSTIEKVEEFPSVKDASPYLLFRLKYKDDGHLFTIGGISLTKDDKALFTTGCAPVNVVNGRFLEDTDQGIIMVGKSYADDRNLALNDEIIIGKRSYTVVGIIKPPIRPVSADVYMTFEDATEVFNEYFNARLMHNDFNLLLVESTSVKTHEQAMKDVEQLILGGSTSLSFDCWSPAGKALNINENAIWLLIGIIGLGTILLSSKTQYTSVIERRHDIGILKIIGWTNKSIISQIVTESVFQSMIGGILGCIIAIIILLSVPIPELINIDVPGGITISWKILGSGLLLALIGGIIAGIFPAFIAAKQNPAEVLRKV